MQKERLKYTDARSKLETGLSDFSTKFRRFHVVKILLISMLFVTFMLAIIYPLYITFYPSSLFVEIFWLCIISAAIFLGYRLFKQNFKFVKNMNIEQKALLLETKFDDHENLLINSLQITEQNKDNQAFQGFIAQQITRDAAMYLNQKSSEFNSKIHWHIVKKLALVLFAVILMFSGTVVFAGGHVISAMKHFFTLGYLLDDFAISTRMTETLGWMLTPEQDFEIVIGDDFDVNAIPDEDSGASEAFVYDTIYADSEDRRPMNFNGNTFTYVFKNVQKDFKYFVASGHKRSRIINVTVVELPKIEKLSLRLQYPEYTQKKDDIIEDFQGDIIALVGSTAILHMKSSQPLKSAKLCLASQKESLTFRKLIGTEDVFAVNIELTANDVFRILLVNSDGRESIRMKERNIKVLPDLLPQIKIITPTQNSLRQPVNSSMSMMLRVFDDFGIEQIRMIIEHADRKDERVLFNNLDTKNVKQQMSSKFVLELNEPEFKVGETVSVHFEATDYNPERSEIEKYSKSRAIEILITEPDVVDEKSEKLLSDVLLRLNLLLNKQRLTKKDTELLIKRINKDRIRKIEETLVLLDTEQKDIRKEIVEISKIANVEEFPKKDAPKILDELAGGAAYEIIKLSSELVKSTVKKEQINTLNKIVPLQDEIINKILALLTMLKQKEDIEDDLSKNKENFDLSRNVQEKLENLKDKLDEFKKKQQRIIELTKELGKKAEEDWTEEDDKIWEECKQAEDDWAKFFEDMRNDLSKLPDQDFSCSEVTDELNQIYQEVRNASDEVVKKNITVAVTREEAGLEIAEELENNLERWLSDTRDYIKWEMEEPTEEYDVPLSDLPDELEDIIGDLIDSEEDITDEVDDVTSSWMDNLDEGAGWDALDGPISNMSAKGVTGNQMPNTSEIGGRSGEGRTGRSSGQFVAKEATGGRGGRKTPTRDDGTAPETGQVKDKSNDAVGGATGGGKLSGDGGQGVRGESNPELKETMRRLQGKQTDVLNRAEKLKRELEKRRYPTEVLDKTIEIMKIVDSELRNFTKYTPDDVKNRIMKIVTQLRQADTSIKDAAKLYQDMTRALPREVRDQVTSAQEEKSPEQYKDLLDNYYRKLLKSR